MFIIRRRSDGMFWRNRDYHSRHREQWAETPNECKPFTTTMGARKSRVPCNACPHDKTRREWVKEVGGYENVKKLHRARWEEIYEIVPVTVEVKDA